MSELPKTKGPWLHRFLIGLFTVLLTLLLVWLIGFVLDDIGAIPGPQYGEVESRFVSQALLDDQKAVDEELAIIGRKLQEQRSRQSLLRDSTSRYTQTMNQLVELQRLNAEKGIAPDESSQKALADSVAFFLSNQNADLALNEEIAKGSEEERRLEERKREIEKKLESQREPARKEFERLQRQTAHRVALFKLLFLLPLLVCVAAVFIKMRSSGYAPIIYAAGIAVLWQTIVVIHEHFPTRYLRYVILLAALVVVVYALVSLLRMLRSPKIGWLLKQYREAYESFVCPVCDYPIRRGPLKNLFWTRRTIKKLNLPPRTMPLGKDEAYTCPVCGSQLFEECTCCHGIRHSLLPYCDKCGAEKTVEART